MAATIVLEWTEVEGYGPDTRYVPKMLEYLIEAGAMERASNFYDVLYDCGADPKISVKSYNPTMLTEPVWVRTGWKRSTETRSGWEPVGYHDTIPLRCGCNKCLGVK